MNIFFYSINKHRQWVGSWGTRREELFSKHFGFQVSAADTGMPALVITGAPLKSTQTVLPTLAVTQSDCLEWLDLKSCFRPQKDGGPLSNFQ